jgi:hypothetical protein
MTKYSKYTWVCTGTCDALIEYTFKDNYILPNLIECPCHSNCTLLSVEDATIQPTNERKQMETTTIGSDALHSPEVEYNPNLLVTSKVASLEWDLHNGRQSQKTVSLLQSKINTVKDIILEAYAESEDQETLQAIAEALDIELTRDIEFTATVEVSGTITLNLLEDYDLESEITDALYVDAHNGNIVIDDTEVCHVREAY